MANKYQDKYRIPSARAAWWDYGHDAAYFVTINADSMKNHYFGQVRDGKMQLSAIGQIARDCWLEIPNHFPIAMLDEFVIMPNHMHGIIIIDKSQNQQQQQGSGVPGDNVKSGDDVGGDGGGNGDDVDDSVGDGDDGDGDDGDGFGRDVVVETRLIASLPTPNPTKPNEIPSIPTQNPANSTEIPSIPTQNPTKPNKTPSISIPNPTNPTHPPSPPIKMEQTPKTPGGITGKNNPMLGMGLGRIIRLYKGRVTFESRKTDPLFAWQARYYDHIIRDDAAFQRIKNYIINNPANWTGDKFYSL